MTSEQIDKWIKEAHDNAVDKGFYNCPECGGKSGYPRNKENINRGYSVKEACKTCKGTGIDPNRNISELLMLIVSELGEALEAHRRGRFCQYVFPEHFSEKTFNAYHFKEKIKDTFEDEIADVFIRLFDLCGYLEIELDLGHFGFNKIVNTAEQLFLCVQDLSDYKNDTDDRYLSVFGDRLIQLCQHYNIPIEKHIEAKMLFNSTRPVKHGKAY